MYKNFLDSIEQMGLDLRFNPCFNGTMYKNFRWYIIFHIVETLVSILVLMELCIKTLRNELENAGKLEFQSLF